MRCRKSCRRGLSFILGKTERSECRFVVGLVMVDLEAGWESHSAGANVAHSLLVVLAQPPINHHVRFSRCTTALM